MLNSDDGKFGNDDEDRASWLRFWNWEFDGEPFWYVVAMAAVPLYVGLLISQFHFADAVLPWALGFMVAGGTVMLWRSLRGGE